MRFDKRQLLKKLQKNPIEDNYETIVNYCKQNVNYLDWKLNNFNDKMLITAASSYLMKYKIGSWDLKDSIFMIYFFAYTVVNKFEIADRIKIKVITEANFEKKYEKNNMGINIYNNETNFIFYSLKLAKQLKSKNTSDLINAIKTIAYQVVEAYQDIIIHDNENIQQFNRKQYIMALEDVSKLNNEEEIYEETPKISYKKNNAELESWNFTISILKQYKANSILEKNEQYIIKNQLKYQKNENDFNQNKIRVSAEKIGKIELNAKMSLYLIPELLDQYPILKLAFDERGHKKRITTILNERKRNLKAYDKETINELYKCILLETLIYGEQKISEDEIDGVPKEIIGETIKKQISFLKQYIIQNDNDKFAKHILNIYLTRQKQENKIDKVHKQNTNIEKVKESEKADKRENKIKNTFTDSDVQLPTKNEKSNKNKFENENRIISKDEYNNFTQQIEDARKEGYMEAMKKLSEEINNYFPYKNYIVAASNIQSINPYFKDYMDKIEFEHHMKKVAKAKKNGDKKSLEILSSEMISKSGYDIYLSNKSIMNSINLYDNNYIEGN